jgi:DNA-binding NarL/FixJ family response regulator
VVAITDAGTDVGRALLADLGRLGPVVRDPEAEVGAGDDSGDGDSPLLPEQRALLERLANGETIAAAAAAEFLSLRTANRRIAQAREALGVRTTREAVLAYLRQRRPS